MKHIEQATLYDFSIFTTIYLIDFWSTKNTLFQDPSFLIQLEGCRVEEIA